jgi:hypothetical protein
MKNKKKLSNLLILLFLSTILVAFILPNFKSEAGPFPALYFYMSRMKADLNGTGDNTVEFILAFEPYQAFDSGSTITIYFPDGQHTEWCRTPGALTIAGVTSSAADLDTTDWDIDADLPGTLSASCTQGTGGGNDPDYITITDVGALSTGTTYGVKLSNSTGILGTGTDTVDHWPIMIQVQKDTSIDFGIFKVLLLEEDQVTVDAYVAEIPSVTCQISDTSLDLGTIFPGAPFATDTNTITTETSETADGYYWVVYGLGNGTNSGLYNTVEDNLIQSGPGATQDLRGFGAEGFGITASPPTNTGGTVTTNFVDTTFGIFGTLGTSGTTGAKLLLYKNASQEIASVSTITYGGRAGTTADPGDYQETVTFVCGGYY